MGMDGQMCYHSWLFSNHIKPRKCTTGRMEPVGGINKDVCGVKQLPMTVLAYAPFLSLNEDTTLLCVLVKV